MSLALSADSRTLATCDGSTIKLWDVESEVCLQTLADHIRWIKSIAFSSDHQTLVSSSDDQTIKRLGLSDRGSALIRCWDIAIVSGQLR
ncbi:MAG: hypothetical protein HC772_09275 [Leptolyngbyaceae cyanobacterium CRU_2_3]|nr:hypothetical protein [Leptolyngbyaceae cyanobacterium CRU_2_3]